MADVDIFIEVLPQGPVRKCRRYYIYRLECARKGGGLHRRGGAGYRDGCSGQRIALTAMLEALGRMARPGRIRLHSGCREISGTAWQGWLPGWMEGGFLTAGGRPVANGDLWERLGGMLAAHSLTVEGDGYDGQDGMLRRLEEYMKEKEGGTGADEAR